MALKEKLAVFLLKPDKLKEEVNKLRTENKLLKQHQQKLQKQPQQQPQQPPQPLSQPPQQPQPSHTQMQTPSPQVEAKKKKKKKSAAAKADAPFTTTDTATTTTTTTTTPITTTTAESTPSPITTTATTTTTTTSKPTNTDTSTPSPAPVACVHDPVTFVDLSNLNTICQLSEIEQVEENLRKKLALMEQHKGEIQKIELEKQKREAERYRELLMCPICMTKTKNTSLKPCGHLLCGDCVKAIIKIGSGKCPVCRSTKSFYLKLILIITSQYHLTSSTNIKPDCCPQIVQQEKVSWSFIYINLYIFLFCVVKNYFTILGVSTIRCFEEQRH
jgi:Zinc finger, C3HC4 type (RING finger)